MSIAVLPPTLESTCASSVVGICTNVDAAFDEARGEAGEIADDAAAEGDDEIVAGDVGLQHGAEQRLQAVKLLVSRRAASEMRDSASGARRRGCR